MLNLIAQVNIGEQYAFGKVHSLGEGVQLLVNPAFSIATVLVIIYFLIGAFKLVASAGDKEAISTSQKMITHAIIGFILLMFSFLIFQFLIGNLFGFDLKLIKQ